MIIRLLPYLNLSGNAEEAMYFYKGVFDRQNKELMRYKEMDQKSMETPWGDSALHGSLTHYRFELFFSDRQKAMTRYPRARFP